jgi:hypothetical protein
MHTLLATDRLPLCRLSASPVCWPLRVCSGWMGWGADAARGRRAEAVVDFALPPGLRGLEAASRQHTAGKRAAGGLAGPSLSLGIAS